MPARPRVVLRTNADEDEDSVQELNSEKLVKSSKKICASSFFTVVFYLLFVSSLTLHHVTDETYKVRTSFDAIRDLQISHELNGEIETSKGWREITSLADMSLWLRDSFVPTLWKDGQSGRGLVLDANRVIGGVSLQQERLQERTCRSEKKRPKLYDMYNSSCYEDDALSLTAMTHVGPSAQIWKNKHTYWLDITQNLSLAQDHIDRMIAAGWTSIASRKVSVQSVFYNAQLEIFVIFEATFQVSRPGSLISESNIWTMPEFVYEGGASNLTTWVDLGFCICLGFIAVLEISHFMDYCRAGNSSVYIISLYRLASLGLILAGICMQCVFYLISYEIEELARRVGGLVEAPGRMEDYLPGQAWSQAWISRHNGLNELFDEMSRVSRLLRWTQLMSFWYSLGIILRLCEGFELSPRMGMVIRTLRMCFFQLGYFIVVFTLCFLNFAVSAHFLFGHVLVEWSTFFFSVSSAFRAIMGDMDFMSMYGIAPVSALSWFILFVLAIVFILVNQFIVIIMDAYQDIQAQDRKARKIVKRLQENVIAMKLQRAASKDSEEEVMSGPETSEPEDDEDDESQHEQEQSDSLGLPQEEHSVLDLAPEMSEAPQFVHTPEDKPPLRVPLDLYSPDDRASTHTGGVNSVPLSTGTSDRSKEDTLQKQLGHSPQHEDARDGQEMTPQSPNAVPLPPWQEMTPPSPNAEREVPLQGPIAVNKSLKFTRGLLTVQARIPSQPPDIIVSARPV